MSCYSHDDVEEGSISIAIIIIIIIIIAVMIIIMWKKYCIITGTTTAKIKMHF